MEEGLGPHDRAVIVPPEGPVEIARPSTPPVIYQPARPETPTTFDYDRIPEEHRAFVQRAALSSRTRMTRMARDMYHFGAELCEIKDRLAHGLFLDWLEQELGMSSRTAERMMQVRIRLGGKIDIVSNLPATALYKLTAPSVPVDVFNECMALAECGQLTAVGIDQLTQAATRKRQPADDADCDALVLMKQLIAGHEAALGVRLTKAAIADINIYLRRLMAAQRSAVVAPHVH